MGLYEQLGVRPVINAFGNVTPFGGSLMDPRVVDAMADAARCFVDVRDLLARAGQYIASLTHVEAACITSGAAAGLVLSTAACVTRKDLAKIAQLPDLRDLPSEVIIHRCQRNVWDQAVRQVGVQLVEIGQDGTATAAELERVIGRQTAAIVYFPNHHQEVSIPLEQVIRVAHARQVPVIVDAAAELPPIENLHRFYDLGADLTIFSGGKMLRGPQCTGLILGRKDLIEACALNASPNVAIGRPMKVGKEEIAGLVRAVELFMAHDFTADRHRWEQQVEHCMRVLQPLSAVQCRRVFPGEDAVLPREVPRLYVTWNDARSRRLPEDVMQQLLAGDPSVAVGPLEDGIAINPCALQEGEEEIVARRVAEVLSNY